MGHLYTIYMQDKLIHDRQPGRSRGTLQAGERRAWLCLKLPFAAKLQGGSELDWGLDAFVCSHGRVAPGCLLTAVGNVLPSHSSPRGYFG